MSIATQITDLPEWMKDLYLGGKDLGGKPFPGIIPGAFRATQEQMGVMFDPVTGDILRDEHGFPVVDPAKQLPTRGFSGIGEGTLAGEFYTKAEQALLQGIGAYAPYLESAQGGFGTAAQMLGAGDLAMRSSLGAAAQFPGAYGYLQQSANIAGAVPAQSEEAFNIGRESGANAQKFLAQQLAQLSAMPAETRQRLVSAAQAETARLRGLESRAFGQTDAAQQQAEEAIARGRNIAGTAAQQLLGSGAMYDPSMTQAFMDPYRRDVVEAQQREMQRLADIQRQGIRAQAVGAGAFGGSREAVQQAELTRNLMDQQSRVAAELMSQGYTQAQANSMAAFEAAQQRQLQGASGAGQIGLSAEQLAAQTGLQSRQLGLQSVQQAMQNAQFLAQQGLSAEQIAAQTGLSAAQIAQAGAGSSAQIGLNVGNLGLQRAQTTLQQADLARQMGLAQGALAGQEADVYRQVGLGQAALAEQMGMLGGRQLQAAEVGARLQGQDASRLLGMTEYHRGMGQQFMDTNYANQMAQWQLPVQQQQWLSDIMRGVPSGQTTVTQQPQQGWGTQAVGLGLTALGLTGGGGGGSFGFGSN